MSHFRKSLKIHFPSPHSHLSSLSRRPRKSCRRGTKDRQGCPDTVDEGLVGRRTLGGSRGWGVTTGHGGSGVPAVLVPRRGGRAAATESSCSWNTEKVWSTVSGHSGGSRGDSSPFSGNTLSASPTRVSARRVSCSPSGDAEGCPSPSPSSSSRASCVDGRGTSSPSVSLSDPRGTCPPSRSVSTGDSLPSFYRVSVSTYRSSTLHNACRWCARRPSPPPFLVFQNHFFRRTWSWVKPCPFPSSFHRRQMETALCFVLVS